MVLEPVDMMSTTVDIKDTFTMPGGTKFIWVPHQHGKPHSWLMDDLSSYFDQVITII
jgi:hypothetical protein